MNRNKCSWCGEVLLTNINFGLCDTCNNQRQSEIDAHNAYVANKKAQVASVVEDAVNINTVRNAVALFQSVDTSQMSDDDIKQFLTDYYAKMKIYFENLN